MAGPASARARTAPQPGETERAARSPAAALARLRAGRWALVALFAAIVVAGGALRLHAAATNHHPLSSDESAYVHLGDALRIRHHYGAPHESDPFRWAPATPVMFAAAAFLSGEHDVGGDENLGPARVAQVLVSTLTILAVGALAGLLGGWVAAIVAAAAIAFYPPAIHDAASLLSEPLGALLLVCAMLVLGLAVRRDRRLQGREQDRYDRRRTIALYAAAGAVLPLGCLARADELAAALVLPLVVLVGRRSIGWRRAAGRAAAMLVTTLVVLAPWALYASSRAGHFVPITDGTQDTLFIATYLPGNGELHYTFLAYKKAACARFHSASACNDDYLTVPPASEVFAIVASHYPGLSQSAAISRAVHDNIHRYLLGEPLEYAGMLARHFWRLWGGYFLGALGYHLDQATLWYHRMLALLCALGLLVGLWRTRDLTLVASAVALLLITLLNTFYVAEARDNERMIPLLVAVGVAGWAMALARGRAASRAGPVSGPSGAVAGTGVISPN